MRQRQVTLDVSGASNATLHGSADRMDITFSGASHGDLNDVAAEVIRAISAAPAART